MLQVRLLSPLNFTLVPHIRPVCLPLSPATTHAGQLATVTGWGSLYSFGPSPTTLQVNTEQQHGVLEYLHTTHYLVPAAQTNYLQAPYQWAGGECDRAE